MTVPGEMSNDDVMATGHNANATGDVASNGVARSTGVTGARFGGTPGGTGTGPVAPPPPATPPPIDYASHAHVDEDPELPPELFPDAAREAGITEMVVHLQLQIDAQGRCTRATPANDPGYGFAAAARHVCEYIHEITPARDHDGHSVPETIRYRIRFVME